MVALGDVSRDVPLGVFGSYFDAGWVSNPRAVYARTWKTCVANQWLFQCHLSAPSASSVVDCHSCLSLPNPCRNTTSGCSSPRGATGNVRSTSSGVPSKLGTCAVQIFRSPYVQHLARGRRGSGWADIELAGSRIAIAAL